MKKSSEDKVLQFFQEIFQEGQDRLDHTAEIKSQELSAEAKRVIVEQANASKQELQELSDHIKNEIINTAKEAGQAALQEMLRELHKTQQLQTKRRGLWFWTK